MHVIVHVQCMYVYTYMYSTCITYRCTCTVHVFCTVQYMHIVHTHVTLYCQNPNAVHKSEERNFSSFLPPHSARDVHGKCMCMFCVHVQCRCICLAWKYKCSDVMSVPGHRLCDCDSTLPSFPSCSVTMASSAHWTFPSTSRW